MADTLPIDASNRGISGRCEEVMMGCSMEALTRKGRNEEASQALDITETPSKTSKCSHSRGRRRHRATHSD